MVIDSLYRQHSISFAWFVARLKLTVFIADTYVSIIPLITVKLVEDL